MQIILDDKIFVEIPILTITVTIQCTLKVSLEKNIVLQLISQFVVITAF